MQAFEIYLNGEKVCVAGVKDDESLTADVCYAPGGAFLHVGGATGPQGDQSRWVDLKPLKVGDKVTIKIVNTNGIDEPLSIEKVTVKTRV
jgi:hypothetical protein